MEISILAIVEDLLFLSKIQQTARLIGVTVQATDPSQASAEISKGIVRAVILDLNHRSVPALEVLRTLRADPTTKHVHILGFVSHVQSDLVTAARQAGCNVVMARSAFTQRLPQLLRELAGTNPDRSA